MNLKDHARQALNQLLLGSSYPQTMAAEHAGRRLTCELPVVDVLACAFTHLSVASDTLADAPPERLERLAEELSKRLNYLLEPMSPIELDPQQCVVQLRSNPPQKEVGQTSYYELLVRRGGEISLCRYSKPSGQPRQVQPAHVTREVLLRLIGDFESVLA